MILIKGASVAICIAEATKRGLSVPDYCLKASGRWTFGYLK